MLLAFAPVLSRILADIKPRLRYPRTNDSSPCILTVRLAGIGRSSDDSSQSYSHPTSYNMPARTSIKPIKPYSDPRVQHKTAVLNGQTYHYLFGRPYNGPVRGTIFLVHGWPDLAIGWRYQIPFLLEMGFVVVAADMMGYGGTDAPKVPPNDIRLYSLKRASDDLAELAKQLGVKKLVLGGHDWGGMVVWRMVHFHPELVTHVFAICTPYAAPQKEYASIESLVDGVLPQFAYQIHLRSPEVEGKINTREQIRHFIDGLYGASGPNAELAFDPYKGVLFENLPKLQRGPLLSDQELDYYTEQYSRTGLHGPVSWYRAREVNWEEEQILLKKPTVEVPTLFVQANRDSVLFPEMSRYMEKYLKDLTRGEVDAGHWVLIEKPDAVNALIKEWLEKVFLGGRSTL
ncbi:alpha/beta-hydrolase [Pseudovirgaria hyperparasitica]|uniref:Alpha/beta-hydrolase n=1 Tax=Pseudovirgaria hyperparasitica TaxID=470096 RepID=A0A6A6WN86_9PEZI|nr:alpha/beta-hydrolase [Pseudovirgaria hyperparasitica]KAF2763482.1 alpha/beta-hydrolase [Pseudovirgaria hyperparasitica]